MKRSTFLSFALIALLPSHYHAENFNTPNLQLSTQERIYQIAPETDLSVIYEHYNDHNFFAHLNKTYVDTELRIEALKLKASDFENYLNIIQQAGVNDLKFIHLCKQAIAWASIEKSLDKDTLYQRSKTAGSTLPIELKHLTKGLRRAYLKLAAQKGQEQAKHELSKYKIELKKYILRKEQELPIH